MEVDHFCFCTDKSDTVAQILNDFGLKEGEPNTHPGQGTANRRFFFQNSMLELLYVNNRNELDSDRTNILGLSDQFNNSNKNKTGIILRPSDNEIKKCPFKSVQYRPIYLPEDLYMNVSHNTIDLEPKFIYLKLARKPNNRENIYHEINGMIFKNITTMVLKNSTDNLSNTATIVKENSNLIFEKSIEDILEIELDNGLLNKSKNFKPDIPLRIKW